MELMDDGPPPQAPVTGTASPTPPPSTALPPPPPPIYPPPARPFPAKPRRPSWEIPVGVLLAIGAFAVFAVVNQVSTLLQPEYPMVASPARQLLIEALGNWWWVYPVAVTVIAAVRRRTGVIIGFWITILVAAMIFLVACFAILSQL
ncbi:MAG: hypothetical protein ABR562_06855 [Thermoplasmatota archaeon]